MTLTQSSPLGVSGWYPFQVGLCSQADMGIGHVGVIQSEVVLAW